MKLAVFFPGIGYNCDKPLLFYSKGIVAQYGYEIKEISYKGLDKPQKGAPDELEACERLACDQAETELKGINWSEYSDVLFISKSIGTVAAAYMTNRLQSLSSAKAAYRMATEGAAPVDSFFVRNVFFTPLEATFVCLSGKGYKCAKDPTTRPGLPGPAVAFSGTADPWITAEAVKAGCNEALIPLHLLEEGNHSLATGNVQRDIIYLKCIMELVEEFVVS